MLPIGLIILFILKITFLYTNIWDKQNNLKSNTFQCYVPCGSVGRAGTCNAMVVGLIPTGDKYERVQKICTHYCNSG